MYDGYQIKLMTQSLEKGIWYDSSGIRRFGVNAIPKDSDIVKVFHHIQNAAASAAKVKWLMSFAGHPQIMVMNPADNVAGAEWVVDSVHLIGADNIIDKRPNEPRPGYWLHITSQSPAQRADNEVSTSSRGFTNNINGLLLALREFDRQINVMNVFRIELHISWIRFLGDTSNWYRPLRTYPA